MKTLTVGRLVPVALLVLALGVSASQAQHHHRRAPHYPSPYHGRVVHPPHCPPGGFPVHPVPGVPVEPVPPPDLPKGEGEPPSMPPVPDAPTDVPPAPDLTTALAPADDGGLGGDLGAGTLGGDLTAGMVGRADAANRFNLFDNMSAVPTTRVWFGYQLLEDFNSNIVNNGSFTTSGNPIAASAARRTNNLGLYRVGAEVARGRMSVAFQTQYIDEFSSASVDAWGTPQILLKYAAIATDTTVVSPIFGFSPTVATRNGELHEFSARYFPGVLAYQKLSDALFLQGGSQFSISQSNLPNTVDYAFSLGYWLYKQDTCGCCPDDCCSDRGGFLRGIVGQVELFGKHVIANGTTNPYELAVRSSSGAIVAAPAFEDRDVLDVTVGGQVLLGRGAYFSSGVSFPITGAQVRSVEFTSYLGYQF